MTVILDQLGAAAPAIAVDARDGALAANTADAVEGRASLIGLGREELAAALVAAGVPAGQGRMRASQLWHWIYHRGVTDFAAMTNVAKDLRRRLAEHFTLARPEIVAEQVSQDGTRKWLMRFPERGAGRPVEVETVYIPEPGRGTLCVSSQVGCTLTCSFCHTGTQKLVRNLTSEEIVAQILVARDRLGDHPGGAVPTDGSVPSEGRLVSNVVMMGMGEPLYNFDNVKTALLIAADGEGIALSRRRITLSTSGVVPEIARAGEEIGVMLAVSLHATNDALRDELVPLNRKYPIAELMAACRSYPGLSNARRITFEYVMLKGVNDSPADARALVRLLSGIPSKINLIPFNPWPGSRYECSDWETIEAFAEIVNRAGYASPIRTAAGPRHPRRLRPAEVGIATHACARANGSARHGRRHGRRLTGASESTSPATGEAFERIRPPINASSSPRGSTSPALKPQIVAGIDAGKRCMDAVEYVSLESDAGVTPIPFPLQPRVGTIGRQRHPHPRPAHPAGTLDAEAAAAADQADPGGVFPPCAAEGGCALRRPATSRATAACCSSATDRSRN